jgi:hypothetical protein
MIIVVFFIRRINNAWFGFIHGGIECSSVQIRKGLLQIL